MSPEPNNIHPRKRHFRFLRRRLPLQGIVGRKIDEREQRKEEGDWKPRQTAEGFMIEMGFPKEWSNDFLDRVTYYEPWLKERYEKVRCRFSRTGGLLRLIQQMSRDDEMELRQQARERRRLDSERQQALHIAQWWREDDGIATGDLIDVMAPLYPGESEEQMTEHMKSWSLKNRLAEHYAARRRIPQ